jgi:hypothetical protein
MRVQIMKTKLSPPRIFAGIVSASMLAFHGSVAQAQQPDTASIIRKVDEAVKARIDHFAGYTVTEHYAVYRSNDEVHPAAEMTVKTTYEQNSERVTPSSRIRALRSCGILC